MSGTAVRLAQFTKFGRKIVAAARNYGYETLYIYVKILWLEYLSYKKLYTFFFNFREHAAELNNPIPPKPLLFMKPPSCYIKEGQAVEVSYFY